MTTSPQHGWMPTLQRALEWDYGCIWSAAYWIGWNRSPIPKKKLAGGLRLCTIPCFDPEDQCLVCEKHFEFNMCQNWSIFNCCTNLWSSYSIFQSLILLTAVCTSQSHKESGRFLFMCSKVTCYWAISFNRNSNSVYWEQMLTFGGGCCCCSGREKRGGGEWGGVGCVLWRLPLVLCDNSPESLGAPTWE